MNSAVSVKPIQVWRAMLEVMIRQISQLIAHETIESKKKKKI